MYISIPSLIIITTTIIIVITIISKISYLIPPFPSEIWRIKKMHKVDTKLQSVARPINTTKNLKSVTFFPLPLLPIISDLHYTELWYRIKLNQRS